MALEGEFGGPTTQNLIQDIYFDMLALFDSKESKADIELVSDFLTDCLEKDLNVDIDDYTVDSMAGVLVKLYDECKDGNFESLNALLKINYEKNENDILFGGKKISSWPPPELVAAPPSTTAEVSNMDVEAPEPTATTTTTTKPTGPKNKPDEDGWIQVKGRRR